MALSGTITGVYRGYTLQTTWTATQNVAGNYSDITCVHKLICASTYALYIDGRANTCTVDGASKAFSSPAISTAGNSTITLGTTTHRVNHNADGSKTANITTVFNMQADIVGTWVSSITASGKITLNAIPRQATITGANNFNDEQNPYFTFKNAGGFQMSAYLTFAGVTITRNNISTATSGGYTFTLTDAERNQLRNATPNSNTMAVVYGLKTTISGTTYTSTLGRTMTIVNANPTAPTLAYSDTNATTVAITGNNQRLIRNKSILTATIGTGTAKKGATITSYSTTINGVTKAGNGSIVFGVVNSAVNTELVCTITDSRGNKATVTRTVVVDDWVEPTAVIQLYRVNNFETESKIKVDATFSSLNGKNAVTCRYRVKNATGTTWTAWEIIADSTLGTLSLDNLNDYNVEVSVNDKLSSNIVYALILPKGIPIVFIDTVKRSVGVNRFPEQSGTLELEGNIRTNGGAGIQGDCIVIGELYGKGQPVCASGSNANGNYIKFYNGTMICWNYQEVTDQAINGEYRAGVLYQGTRNITYPQAFTQTPTLMCTMFKWGNSASWGGTTEHNSPLTQGTLRGYDAYPRASGTTVRIGWVAIGKWK